MKIKLLIVLISLFWNARLFALEQHNVDEITDYMQVSGMTETLESLPAQLDSVVMQSQITSLDDEIDQRVIRVLGQAWETVDVKAIIIDHIRRQASPEDLRAFLRWRKGELAQKFVKAELASTQPSYSQDFLRYVADLHVAPPSKDTRTAIRRVIVATDMVQHMVDISLQVSSVMTSVFVDASPSEKPHYLADMHDEMQDMRVALAQQMEAQVVLTSYYLYRDISPDELNQYALFFESELGKRELQLITESISVAIAAWAKQAAQDIVARRDIN